MRRTPQLLTCALLLFVGASAALGQETYTSGNDDYMLELPSQTWKVTPRSENAHQLMEFIYGERSDGFLRLRKEVVEASASLSEVARREQDLKLRYLPGFVGGKEERFAGRLNGITASYEYTNAGKPMAGRIYYLQADNRTVYTLHFTARAEKLMRIRTQTDAIARSFRLKQ
ncbi:MAG: hypothetical protein LC802_16080 [Acidobacteria bacterium]|nr:hypothetical protein [Acidobacteriota bacterium]